MNPSALSMTASKTPKNNIPTDFFGSEQNSRCIKPTKTQRQQGETSKPNDCEIPVHTTIDFGPESYQTPRRKQMNYCTLSLDPPPAPRKMKYLDDDGAIRRKKQRTMASIHIPSTLSLTPSRTNIPSFQLQARAECTYDSPQRFNPDLTLSNSPDCILFHQETRSSESKMQPSSFQARMLRCKLEPQFGNLQITTIQTFERTKRRDSVAAMSA